MKYQNGKIYKILNSETSDIYVGSTCQRLAKRMMNHRTRVKEGKDTLLYLEMREIGIEHFYIELVENFPCENLEQLNKREGEWMREIATLNEKVAGRTKNEYAEEHRESKNQNQENIIKKIERAFYKDRGNIMKKTKIELRKNIRNTMKNINKKYTHIVMRERTINQNITKRITVQIRNSHTISIKNGWRKTRLKQFVKFVIANILNMIERIIYKENII